MTRPMDLGTRAAMARLRPCFALLALLALGPAGSSRLAYAQEADRRAQAKELVEKGLKAQADGRYGEAIALYKDAYDLMPHPELLYNLGQAYRLQGEPSIALAFYQSYLAEQPDGRAAAEARSWADLLEQSLAGSAQLGRSETPAPLPNESEAEQLPAIVATEEPNALPAPQDADEGASQDAPGLIDLRHYEDILPRRREVKAGPRQPARLARRTSATEGDWRRSAAILSGMGSVVCFAGALAIEVGIDTDDQLLDGTVRGTALVGLGLGLTSALLLLTRDDDGPKHRPSQVRPSKKTTSASSPRPMVIPALHPGNAGVVVQTSF